MATKFTIELDPSSSHDIYGREVRDFVHMGLVVESEPNKFVRPEWNDTVFFDDSFTAEDVKKSLVEHDGYNPDIEVTKEGV